MSEERVGRYIIKEKLGSGGMATVFRAYDPQFGRDVALKMLPVGPGYDHDFLERKFQQEARIIASLEHFAIVPVYDFGSQDGRPFLVMRLMPGGTLKEHLSHGPVPLPEAQHVLDRICSALDKAHARHIVHRDVKPTNIFLDDDGLVYLGDFGIARVTAGDQTNSRIGSPRYMAPEMVQGNPLIPQTDIYQMGIVLYEMLTGQLPFVGETTEHTMMLHLQGEIPRPSAQNGAIPRAVDDVISMALAKSPQHRFKTAGTLADAFRAALSGRSPFEETADQTELGFEYGAPQTGQSVVPATQAGQTPSSYSSSPAAQAPYGGPQAEAAPPAPRRNRIWIAALSAVALLMLACGASIYALASRDLLTLLPEPDPTIAPPPSLASPTEAGTNNEATEIVQAGGEESDEDEPDLAPTVTLEGDATEAPLADGIITISPQDLVETGGGSGVTTYVAQQNDQYDIFVTTADGEARQLTNTPGIDEFNPTFSPNGQRIAYHALESQNRTWEIYLTGVNGGAPRNLTNNPADDTFAAWSPDGRFIAFHTNRNRSADNQVQFDIYIIDVNTGESDRLTTSDMSELGPTWSPDGSQIAFSKHEKVNLPGEIYIMERNGENERQLTALGAKSEHPVWSPDGTKIAFMTNSTGISQIFIVDIESGATQQISDGSAAAFYPNWSANSEWVIYHMRADSTSNNRDLFMSRVDGSETIRLTETEEEERQPDYN